MSSWVGNPGRPPYVIPCGSAGLKKGTIFILFLQQNSTVWPQCYSAMVNRGHFNEILLYATDLSGTEDSFGTFFRSRSKHLGLLSVRGDLFYSDYIGWQKGLAYGISSAYTLVQYNINKFFDEVLQRYFQSNDALPLSLFDLPVLFTEIGQIESSHGYRLSLYSDMMQWINSTRNRSHKHNCIYFERNDGTVFKEIGLVSFFW